MYDNNHKKLLKACCKKLGIKFKNINSLKVALTHRSYVNESRKNLENNEKLEFLGDSVLGLSVNHFLYKKFPEYREGGLAKIKNIVVSEKILSKLSTQLDIGNFILLGKGEVVSGGRKRSTILADTLEAIIGAYYLDSGFNKSYTFIINVFKDILLETAAETNKDTHRTNLQLYTQKHFKLLPEYIMVSHEGPAHSKLFTMKVIISDVPFCSGRGLTKKEACQEAAKKSLSKLKKQINNSSLSEDLLRHFSTPKTKKPQKKGNK